MVNHIWQTRLEVHPSARVYTGPLICRTYLLTLTSGGEYFAFACFYTNQRTMQSRGWTSPRSAERVEGLQSLTDDTTCPSLCVSLTLRFGLARRALNYLDKASAARMRKEILVSEVNMDVKLPMDQPEVDANETRVANTYTHIGRLPLGICSSCGLMENEHQH